MNTEQALAFYTHRKNECFKMYNTPARPIIRYDSNVMTMDEKWGVQVSHLQPDARKLLVTGTGRVGTNYISDVLKAIGLDVPHGMVGRDGVVSQYFVVDSDWNPMITWMPYGSDHVGERKSDYEFENVIHLVRHPGITISSIDVMFSYLDYRFLEENGVIPDGLLWRSDKKYWKAMLVYYHVNRYILDHYPNALLVRLETFAQQWYDILDLLAMSYVDLPVIPPRNRNTEFIFSDEELLVREYFGETKMIYERSTDLSFAQLKSIDPQYAAGIENIAKEFGYV